MDTGNLCSLQQPAGGDFFGFKDCAEAYFIYDLCKHFPYELMVSVANFKSYFITTVLYRVKQTGQQDVFDKSCYVWFQKDKLVMTIISSEPQNGPVFPSAAGSD